MTTWPRRRRTPVDDAALTIAGGATYLQRQRGRENGFYDPKAPIAADGTRESLSQRRDREYARAWRLRLGPEQWQELVSAYATEIEQALKAENITERKKGNV